MAGSRNTGYKNERSYNRNGSYKTVYTAGSAASENRRRASGRSAAYDRSAGVSRQADYRNARETGNTGSRAYDGAGSRFNGNGAGRQPYGYAAGKAGVYSTGGGRRADHNRRRENSLQQPGRPETPYAGNYQAVPAFDPADPVRREQKRKRKPQTRQERMAAERRRHIALRNQRRAAEMNAGYVTLLTVLILISCIICGVFVQRGLTVRNSMSRVSTLQSELADLRQKNNAEETKIYSSTDLNTIKKDAKELGMSYADPEQIIYFTMDSSDYVNDFSAID